ncbi:MAG: hypothetical protein KC983_04820 [Phycisphaerales bacterium]|nr:hypothetical protein [Phycisphaerales bacterium]
MMTLFSRHLTACAVLGASCFTLSAHAISGPMEEEHFDVWLRLDGGQVVTGSRFEDETIRSLNERVFGAELGEDPLFPFSGDEPGLQAFGTDFAPSTVFDFRVTDALGVWNGTGFDMAAETMTLGFEGESVTTGSGALAGFQFATDDAGFLHDHFELTLNGAGGSDPGTGVYLLGLSVGIFGDESSFSETFYYVLNLGESEEVHELAIDYVAGSLVPAPGALVCLVMGLAARGRSRRR